MRGKGSGRKGAEKNDVTKPSGIKRHCVVGYLLVIYINSMACKLPSKNVQGKLLCD